MNMAVDEARKDCVALSVDDPGRAGNLADFSCCANCRNDTTRDGQRFGVGTIKPDDLAV